MSQAQSHFPFAVCPGTENETVDFRIVGTKDGKLAFAGVQGSYLWPYDPNSEKGYNITYCLISGGDTRRAVVSNIFKVFEEYSGIDFAYVPKPAGSNIRILLSTDPKAQAWSAIGTTADKTPNGPTLTLPLGFTVAQAYHVVGHALGLEHECDGKTNFKNTRHGDLFKGQVQSNFPPLKSGTPVKTIMRYEIENTQTSLSELDKAWLAINYPKRKKDDEGKILPGVIENVKTQAQILGIDEAVAIEIANADTKPPAMRRLYNRYTSESWAVKYDSLHELLGALHITQGSNASALDGVSFSALMHPMFEAGVTRIIEEQLVKDGLLAREDIEPAPAYSLDMTVGAPEAQYWIGELAGIVGTLLPLVLRGAPPPRPGQAAHSLDPTTGPPEAQHWIGAVLGVLGAILPVVMNGVPPPPGAAHAANYSVQLPLQVQHNVLSNLSMLLKHPLLISTVKEVAGRL